MPSCRVTNKTGQPLNICLKQVTALHFENTVQPGQEVKFKPGRVWFTLEALVDDGSKKSRYSVLKSAATIAVVSVAVGAVAATAGAALLPEAVTLEAVAAGSVAGSYLVKSMAVTKTALVTHSGAIARVSSVMLPKAIDRLSAEIGGLSALQREVLSIVASPSLSSDVRHRATTLLRQLSDAYSRDKTARAADIANQASARPPTYVSTTPVPPPALSPNKKPSRISNIFHRTRSEKASEEDQEKDASDSGDEREKHLSKKEKKLQEKESKEALVKEEKVRAEGRLADLFKDKARVGDDEAGPVDDKPTTVALEGGDSDGLKPPGPGNDYDSPSPVSSPEKPTPLVLAPEGEAKTAASSTGKTPPRAASPPLTPLPLDPASLSDLEPGRADSRVEHVPVRTGEVLRVHGIYMDRRRHFEIRVGEWGRLELWDAVEGKLWS